MIYFYLLLLFCFPPVFFISLKASSDDIGRVQGGMAVDKFCIIEYGQSWVEHQLSGELLHTLPVTGRDHRSGFQDCEEEVSSNGLEEENI